MGQKMNESGTGETIPLKLSRFLSDGAVLEHKKPIHIWGYGTPESKITAVFDGMTETTEINTEGRFDIDFPIHTAGGPYILTVSDDQNHSITVKDIMVGAVWYCSGQSNMDLMMERVRDSYPDILSDCTDDGIRNYKLATSVNYHGPLEEPESGEWKKAEPNNIMAFSATAYFFARKLREKTGLTVGIIHSSLGGSRIHGWLSREMLDGYDELLSEAEPYADDDYLAGQITKNETQSKKWHEELDSKDEGVKKSWQNGFPDGSEKSLMLPAVFEDTELKDFTGSIWFEKEFTVPREMAGQPAHLWMGTMVDSDTVYLNGQKIGETGYQYPPRKYLIPEATLHAGTNTLVVRLIVENGKGRWTPGKGYFLFNDQGVIDLKGEWKYKTGAVSKAIPETDFVNWKATGLFNAMCAPCTHYPIEGIVWYQGEENAPLKWDYLDLTKRQIKGYRRLWKDDKLPYLFVQLPNFTEDLRDLPGKWPALRECQRMASTEPYTGMIVSMDLGEDNDLHPHGKRRIGERLASQALHMVYGRDEEYTGPVPESYSLSECKNGTEILITLAHAEGLHSSSLDKGDELMDFSVIDISGNEVQAEAAIENKNIRLRVPLHTTDIKEIRYLYKNTNHGGLVYNRDKFPMSPFVLRKH
ncbi:sialate O-acetylesterase [Oribacterium sp. WCC10]|uniref:sialate O-acetylesterase n=1 Tax=Oribacterium sp. WCC10 TaxID=1855343 RepID=UPI0008ED5A4D|nr:sialate O-acetylesterase [Oribacterium sp. WCC10]SFG20589.1 sialate O-acetylesterase [Oribacterium sp. WCC10]